MNTGQSDLLFAALSALVGALVGGVFSLIGSYFATKWQSEAARRQTREGRAFRLREARNRQWFRCLSLLDEAMTHQVADAEQTQLRIDPSRSRYQEGKCEPVYDATAERKCRHRLAHVVRWMQFFEPSDDLLASLSGVMTLLTVDGGSIDEIQANLLEFLRQEAKARHVIHELAGAVRREYSDLLKTL